MKKITLFFLIFVTFQTYQLKAQNITVNPGAGSYSDLKSAFDAINNGTHTGDIIIAISGSTSEAASAVLNESGSGNASYTSVTIYPTLSGLTISGNIGAPLIDLNGADNVTIDGRVNGSGSTLDLSLINYSTSNVASTIRFINDATTNVVKYSTLKGSPTQPNSILPISGIINLSTAGNGNGNDDNVISNNNFTNAGSRLQCAIFSSGTSGKENSGVIISNNNIFDIITFNAINAQMVYIASNNSDFQLLSNSFYETTYWNSGNTSYTVININNAGNNYNISNNYIGGSAPLCGGSPWTKGTGGRVGFNCIYMNVGTTIPSNIQGNTITNWNYSNSSNTRDWCGIWIAGGSINIGTITQNIIGSGTSINAIQCFNCLTLWGMNLNGNGNINVKNNIIGSLTNSTSSTIQAISASVSGALTIENNTIGSTSSSNSIYASNTSSSGVWGVNVNNSGSGNTIIKGNTISNIASNATINSSVTGIRYSGNMNSAEISNNFIRDISFSNSASSGSLFGIDLVSGTNTTHNNILSLGNNNPSTIYGISTSGGINNIYFNTVYFSGTPTSGSFNSYSLFSSSANTRDIRNNIFFNSRSNSGASGNHFAAYFSNAGTGLTLNYNDYFVSGTGGLLGYYNTNTINSIADWKTATSMDVRSQSINPSMSNAGGTLASDYFPSETSLLAAANTSVTTDFFGGTRNNIAPSMGGFEYTIIACIDPSSGGSFTTNQSINVGNTAILTSTSLPTGEIGNLEYKWQYSTTSSSTGFSDFSSSNSLSYTTTALNVDTWFKRLARVDCSSDWNSAAESNVIGVTVTTPSVSITSSAINNSVCSGNSLTFTASPLHASNPTYQWYKNGSAIIGSTGTVYTTNELANNDAIYVEMNVPGTGIVQSNTINNTVSQSTLVLTALKLSNGATTVASLTSNLTWTINTNLNDAHALFQITSGHVLSFISPMNYSNVQNNIYSVSVSSGCKIKNITVTISPICGSWDEISSGSGDGLSISNSGESAYQIKRDFPNSVDGFYWIVNANINNGAPFKIYADMTTDGGGWTLIMKNSNKNGWNYNNAILLNSSMPYTTSADIISTSTVNYSIIEWADYIKKSSIGFEYMIDANSRRSYGGIWTSNANYSFTSASNSNTNITLNTRFGTWNYYNAGIEERMPWYSNHGAGDAFITTDGNNSGWWGTLITDGDWSPAPWIENLITQPGIIWYWVR